ncbi:MAG: hypothetical protein RLZZ164_405 [Actinomycetota bacterium]|jgi:manganese transport protein
MKAPKGVALLGPAIVAAVAYLDPGNVATNLSAGAGFGYLLTWVIVLANLMAWLVQYLSAKLGLVTGSTLPELLGARMRTGRGRFAFWLQAQVVAIATDVAEVIGGALALNLLFNLPVLTGGVITGVISTFLLSLRSRGLLRAFEFVILALVLITGVGFVAALFVAPPAVSGIASGLIPGFADSTSVLLAVGIFGATIMPHAIYAHSALSRDRFAAIMHTTNLRVLLRATKWDVTIAMALAGLVNLAILFVGASALSGVTISNSISGAYIALHASLGTTVAVLFAFGLLASGLASSAVGTFAGGVITQGFLKREWNPLVLRVVTLLPALVVIAVASDPTQALVYSQVLLSFGLPFAVFPLVRLTSDARLMGEHVNGRLTRFLGYSVAILVTTLNLALLWLTFAS